MRPKTLIVLLRGINVGGHNKVPMSDLRTLCVENGWADVRTYLQSGNLVLRTEASATSVEGELERSIEHRFGLSIPVFVRAARDWGTYARGNPFVDACDTQAPRVMLALSKAVPREDAVERLLRQSAMGERILKVGGVLWIHYPGGVAKSRLSPGRLERAVGSPVTTRNWRTVLKLAELAGPVAV